MHGSAEDVADRVSVHFWSGGKDSYLALRAMARVTPPHERDSVLLLTTFDDRSQMVAHQEVDIGLIVRQATALRLPLVGVPLHGTAGSYVDHVRHALNFICRDGCVVVRIVFGDLHLARIRAWRDEHLGGNALASCNEGSGISTAVAPVLHYPLWQAKYDVLAEDLDASGVTVRVCAIGRQDLLGDSVRVGDIFDEALRERLRELKVDEFGEEGELHTAVEVWQDGMSTLPWGEGIASGGNEVQKNVI
jgi:diphthamide synthase (EF-2-diphthine--ammonia ligase)